MANIIGYLANPCNHEVLWVWKFLVLNMDFSIIELGIKPEVMSILPKFHKSKCKNNLIFFLPLIYLVAFKYL
jgi:hypothetical protein